jgi:hypothetical protein
VTCWVRLVAGGWCVRVSGVIGEFFAIVAAVAGAVAICWESVGLV